MLDSYVYGPVLQEQQHAIAAPQDTQGSANDLLAGLPVGELPHLRAVAEAISAGPAPSHDQAFAHGLSPDPRRASPWRGSHLTADDGVKRTGATRCYGAGVRSISQRELRNDNAEVIRDVEAGESFTVTRHGVPVARLVPLSESVDIPCERPARVRHRWSERSRVRSATATAVMIDDLRGER